MLPLFLIFVLIIVLIRFKVPIGRIFIVVGVPPGAPTIGVIAAHEDVRRAHHSRKSGASRMLVCPLNLRFFSIDIHNTPLMLSALCYPCF